MVMGGVAAGYYSEEGKKNRSFDRGVGYEPGVTLDQ